jgi:hypothetical protein
MSPTSISHIPSPAAAQVLQERVYSPEPLLQHPWKMLMAIAADVWAGWLGC